MNGAASAWYEGSLQEVTRPDAPIGYGIVQVGPYDRMGVPVLAIRDLFSPSTQTAHRSSPRVEAAYRRSRVRGGDLLLSVKGTTGRVGIVPPHFEGNISRDVARIRLRDEHDPHYWLHLLRSDLAQQTLRLAAVGTTRQELSIGTLKTLRFRFPDKAEQSRIAAVLTDFDDSLDALQRSMAKRQNVKLAVAHQLLARECRSGVWKSLTLGDLATISKGQQLGRAEMDSMGAIPVWNGGVEPSGLTTAPNVHDPVVTVSEGGNSCGWVGRPQGPFWLGGHCYALRPRRPDTPLPLLYQTLKFHEGQIMALRVGSGLPNIQKARLLDLVVDVPASPSDALRIGETLDALDSDVRALERERVKLGAVKRGTLQQLISTRPAGEAV